jgi:hypothetical protein
MTLRRHRSNWLLDQYLYLHTLDGRQCNYLPARSSIINKRHVWSDCSDFEMPPNQNRKWEIDTGILSAPFASNLTKRRRKTVVLVALGFCRGRSCFCQINSSFLVIYLIRNTFVRSSVKASNMIYFVFLNATFIIVVLI